MSRAHRNMGRSMELNKVKESWRQALEPLRSGDSVMVGGFGLIGAPLTLIEGLTQTDVKELTVISNNVGEKGRGLGKVLLQRKIKKAVGSYFTSNRDVGDMYARGEIELELVPQGTLAERIRAGGAGICAFFTPTAAGKDTREFDGRLCVMELGLRANVALIRAHKADTYGNLVYAKTARNFNAVMATAADYVVAEVAEVVEPGQLDPDLVVTPHLFVDAVIQATKVYTAEGVKDRDER